MARTKQTARNSTGGTSVLVNLSSRPLEIGEKAPHPPLPIKHLRSSTVRELATVVALANGASNSKPSALSQIRQASQIRRTRLSAAPLAAGHTVQSPSSQSIDSPGPELPIGNIEDVSTYLLCTSGIWILTLFLSVVRSLYQRRGRPRWLPEVHSYQLL